jgi:hypothetical protein
MSHPIVTIEMESGAVMTGELYPELAPTPSTTSSRWQTPAFMTALFSTASSPAL